MSKRLAVTIAGAVSLGSFEAGVMYEVIRAIGEHNESAAQEDQILIDVLTGASAGGMTAAVTAQKLMFESAALGGPYTNDLYRAWVRDIDISELLGDHPDDSDTKSIFSSGYVEDLSKRCITARYNAGPPPLRQKHQAAADKIWLGLALANLNGVDYGLKTSAGDFTYTCFQDSFLRPVENTPVFDTFAYWEPIRNAAVSSGAFPFAFRPVEMVRHPCEYLSPNLESTILANQNFCYTDGGTFQNQPLGMAKNLVDIVDPTHTNTAGRYYLFVSPRDKTSDASQALNADNADFIPFAKDLVSVVYHQAQFQDWIMAEEVNGQIALLDARAEELSRLLKDQPANAAVLRPASQLLLSALFPGVDPQSSGSNPINDARDRLRILYKAECAALPADAQHVLIDCVLALEKAACLGEKDEMNILGITASDGELAGAKLACFAGFFDIKYRKHDYDLGRIKARSFLLAGNSPLGRINYHPEEIAPLEDFGDLNVEDIDKKSRENVYDRFEDRILRALAAANIGLVERKALYEVVIRPRLKNVLGL